MGKVHKSLRIDEALAGRVDAVKDDRESDSAAYSRIIEAGVSLLEAGGGDAQGAAPTDPNAGGAAVEALAATVDVLTAQLAIKDEQIASLTRLTEQAQTLHAMQAAKAIEQPREQDDQDVEVEESRGFAARLRRFFA